MADSPKQKRVPCPTCGKPVVWSKEHRWKPFCSERCKMIDLGAWFDETNRIQGKEATEGNLEND
jgi:endogenous inhibitor of DNA gyrase (YacG/DUF329 family)